MSIGELVKIKRKVFFADMMEAADNPMLKQAPEAIQVGGMDDSTDIFNLACFRVLWG